MAAEPEQQGGPTEADKKRLEGTNMENYGSKEHRDLRKKAAQGERAWSGIPDIKEPGVRVWRIEKFNVVDWGKGKKGGEGNDNFGTFFAGDSFIILDAYKPESNNPEEEKDQILYNIHFWLGNDTTQDEMGTAAYKTVELDDLLDDLPVQYREVQGHESKLFKDLFPTMNILEGGVESGFRHVEPKTYKPRLLHVHGERKGRKTKVQNQQVQLSASELNSTDCFVLDLGDVVIAFVGDSANVWEKRATNEVIENIRQMRNGRCEKKTIDFSDDCDTAKRFWDTLGGKPESLPETAGFKERKAKDEESFANHVNKLFHVTDETGELVIEEKQSGVLDRSILEEEKDDVIIVDVGRCVWVWLGPECNKNEQVEAMSYASQYLEKTGRPRWTPIVRVAHGAEPADFWKCFGCEHVSKDIV